jgi:phosphoglycolate phosphatase
MPDTQPARLVLWDVDHTLVDSGGVGERLYERAFRTVLGQPLEQLAAMTGRTDRAIIAETLTRHGLDPTAARLNDFYVALTAAAHELRDDMRAQGRALPGAQEAINALARVGTVQSVVTGNLPGIAEIKLAAFGLTRHLDLEIGGYGSDGDTRPPLIRVAMSRAEAKYGRHVPPEHVVVIGDTPLDVAAARQVGAAMVAVASGGSSIQALQAAGARPVLPDLTDTDTLVKLVLDAR